MKEISETRAAYLRLKALKEQLQGKRKSKKQLSEAQRVAFVGPVGKASKKALKPKLKPRPRHPKLSKGEGNHEPNNAA